VGAKIYEGGDEKQKISESGPNIVNIAIIHIVIGLSKKPLYYRYAVKIDCPIWVNDCMLYWSISIISCAFTISVLHPHNFCTKLYAQTYNTASGIVWLFHYASHFPYYSRKLFRHVPKYNNAIHAHLHNIMDMHGHRILICFCYKFLFCICSTAIFYNCRIRVHVTSVAICSSGCHIYVQLLRCLTFYTPSD